VTYLLLLLAIGIEVAATSLLPRTAGFTAPLPTLAVLVGYGLAVSLLAQVVQTVPVGVAYAIWSGVGTLAVVAIGAVVLGQALTVWQLLGAVLVVGGVVLLDLGGPAR
jgi:small multidrug resistance pump